MKKYILLLLCTVSLYGQTYQNPTFGTVKTKTSPTVTSVNHLATVEADGTIAKIDPVNLPFLTLSGDQTGTTAIKRLDWRIRFGASDLGSFLTTGRHLSQFNAGTDQTPIAISGGTSSIEYFKDLLTPRYAWATGLQNPSDNTDLKDSFKWFWAKPEIPAVPYVEILKLTEQGNLYTKGNLSENITELTPTISGQPAIIKYVNSLNSTQPVKLVIYFHGSGANQLDPFTDPNSKHVIDKLLSEGYIVATSQAHGNAWGNQASQDDYLALYNYVNSAYNIMDVVYIGHSMGGLASLSMLSKNTIPKAKIWYGIMPVTNLADAYSVPAFITPIETAYSFSGGANYAAATAGYDPQLLVTSTYAGSKYTMTASASDVTVSKTNNSDLFNTKLTTGSIQSSVITATGVHGDISHFIPKSVYRFVQNIPIFTSEIGYLPRLDVNGFYINSAILDDGVNLNLGRNTRLTGSTPTFSLINSASSNKRWDMRVNGASWMLTESGIGNQLVFAAGGVATFTNNVIVPNGATSGHAVNKGQLDLKANLAGTQTFTGIHNFPTATAGTNTTQVATTAFVTGALPTSGSYTPTLTAVTNTTSITLKNATYTRIGNIVTACIGFDFQATNSATETTFTISLPVNRGSTTSINIGTGSMYRTGGIDLIMCQSSSTSIVGCTLVASNNILSTGSVNIQYTTN